jgi:ubiquinone/menaquinone biosynthesis C-methylase UbiE
MATLQFTDDQARQLEAIYSTADVVAQRDETLRLLAITPAESAIDVGCGPGFLCESMADLVGPRGRVLGVDISPDLVALARSRNHRSWLTYEVGDALALVVPDQSFDVAVCTQVLEYVADADRAIRELHRLLRPGGRALIVDTDWNSVVWRSNDSARMARVLSAWEAHCTDPRLPRSLIPRLSAAGFKTRSVRGFPIINMTLAEQNYSGGILHFVFDFVRRQESVAVDELEAWRTELQTLSERGEYFFATMRLMFMVQKDQ